MARIELSDVSTFDDAESAQHCRFPANLTRALLRTGGCTAAFLDLGIALRTTHLDAKQYELVILRVAALSHSAYERMQHLEPARQAGWSEAEIAAIEQGDGSLLDPRSAALVVFVDDCVQNVRVSDQSFMGIRKYLSENAVADATLLVGFYMMTARFLETLAVDLDEVACDVLLNR
ncbi:carboxymuconolactone decarboxylase family protein [Nitrosovibrio sp. Nv6]|uniref:carboxymuconolactone decarboxylase family protein n=1 Tax=Nitrosovibrio sp. Nv6 TaxID=1855340 RepID=UPI0008AF1220|nr:carboxymuconolactone decarboxylase family protein [Nitrosovibrio sp. Nv6]SEP23441.1 Alkylhydroperoxidase family enzyme, contains CxxC motif [Nitrosovibrio sp. Nv6]